VWSKGFVNATAIGPVASRTLALDATGNAIVVGDFVGPGDVGGNPVNPSGGAPMFAAKFAAADGAHIWSKDGWGTSGNAHFIVSDAAGDLYVTGFVKNGDDLGTGALLHTYPDGAPGSGFNMFVAKLTGTTGATVWSEAFGGPQEAMQPLPYGEAFNASGKLVVIGVTADDVKFGPGPGSPTHVFLAAFDTASGAHVSDRNFLGPSARSLVALGPFGEQCVAGTLILGADFGSGALAANGTNAFFATLP
jgi:hypothetical protein